MAGHTTVLLQEAIDGLDLHPGDIFVDGTLGSGGHSEEVLKRLGKNVTVIGIDMDVDAIDRSKRRLELLGSKVHFVEGNFRTIDAILSNLGIQAVDKILLDIGLSSNQFEESGRGFSFQKDEPLRMTFKKDPTDDDVTAYTIVNEWSEETITTLLEHYGEERYARRIASTIVQARERKPIESTFELVNIVIEATPRAYHHRRIHAATKTFQALRIAVNNELQALQEGLEKGFACLKPNGRMAVISFHSLEDRIVKNFFKDKAKEDQATLIAKKPLVPSEEEQERNRRSRSAKLRILIKK